MSDNIMSIRETAERIYNDAQSRKERADMLRAISNSLDRLYRTLEETGKLPTNVRVTITVEGSAGQTTHSAAGNLKEEVIRLIIAQKAETASRLIDGLTGQQT